MISLGPFQRLTGIEFPGGWVVLEQSGFVNPEAGFVPETFTETNPDYITSAGFIFEPFGARQKIVVRNTFDGTGIPTLTYVATSAGGSSDVDQMIFTIFLNDLRWQSWEPWSNDPDLGIKFFLPGEDKVSLQDGINEIRIEADTVIPQERIVETRWGFFEFL